MRLIGGVFPGADKIKGFKTWRNFKFNISIKNQHGVSVYKHTEKFNLVPGAPGADFLDLEIPIPMNGVPDGTYTLKVEALSPVTGKAFHTYERKLEIFGNRLKETENKLALSLDDKSSPEDRVFVTALSKIKDIQIKDGKAVVPIGVEDGSSVKRENFPVTLGVPFPKRTFKTNAPVKLLSSQNKVVAAQFEVMNVWPDKSLKWLRIDFQANCLPNAYVFYNLHIGKGIKQQKSQNKNLIVERNGGLEIVTSPMKVLIDKKKLAIPGKIYIDSNHDKKFTEDELITGTFSGGSAWWKASDGKMYTMTCEGSIVFTSNQVLKLLLMESFQLLL